MYRIWAAITIFVAAASAQPVSPDDFTMVQERKTPPKSESKKTSLTGCIDEQDGHYVLIDNRTLTPIANLEAEGFPTEGFAKHLGHKVTVRGISNSGTGRPVFTVRSIETISETCAPQQ